MSIQIRSATLLDINEAVPMSYEALKEYADYITLSSDKNTVVSRLKSFFNHTLVTQLHLSSFSVLTKNSSIIGSISSFPGNLIPAYNKNISKIIENIPASKKKIFETQSSLLSNEILEADSDEYYIDTLSIKSKYKGQGYAANLILSAEKKAKQANFNKLALVVDVNKPRLVNFYKKQFFIIKSTKNIGGITYYSMIKYI